MPIEPPRCPKCGLPLREEHSHYRCAICGIVEACCEGEVAQRPFVEDGSKGKKKGAPKPGRGLPKVGPRRRARST